ncbi:hypothetical protein RRG08_039849 [Elysia crispata]|uniref:Uncharacterized protein n=1 Tax=Elysia crispata TaxID=231223 RepID=A0AAE0ZV78_9GAST|nr:hypothetical protein RRG08_039849 [Elysia crispata]
MLLQYIWYTDSTSVVCTDEHRYDWCDESKMSSGQRSKQACFAYCSREAESSVCFTLHASCTVHFRVSLESVLIRPYPGY